MLLAVTELKKHHTSDRATATWLKLMMENSKPLGRSLLQGQRISLGTVKNDIAQQVNLPVRLKVWRVGSNIPVETDRIEQRRAKNKKKLPRLTGVLAYFKVR